MHKQKNTNANFDGGLLEKCIKKTYSSKILAFKYSRFKRAILVSLISLGHSASQAPMLVQLPKPSASI